MTAYLTEKQIATINTLVIEKYSPKETVKVVSPSALNMIVNLPEQYVFGSPLYPTIFDKAMIQYVQLIKKHVFANANKRTAFFVLVKFLRLNGFRLMVTHDKAVEMTVKIAIEPITEDKLAEYSQWISDHSVQL